MSKDYTTTQDLKAFEERLDKKLADRLNASFEAFRQENAYQFKLMREELHYDFSKFTSRILTVIDPLLAELETRQQDRGMQTAQITKIRADIKDLDKRVSKLNHQSKTTS